MMDLDLSTWMMIAFVVFMVLGIWKIWAFLPNEQLADDDKNPHAEQKLEDIMLNTICQHQGKLTPQELFEAMKASDGFDKELFWRFNLNRLNQLLKHYYLKHEELHSIEDIYKASKQTDPREDG